MLRNCNQSQRFNRHSCLLFALLDTEIDLFPLYKKKTILTSVKLFGTSNNGQSARVSACSESCWSCASWWSHILCLSTSMSTGGLARKVNLLEGSLAQRPLIKSQKKSNTLSTPWEYWAYCASKDNFIDQSTLGRLCGQFHAGRLHLPVTFYPVSILGWADPRAEVIFF